MFTIEVQPNGIADSDSLTFHAGTAAEVRQILVAEIGGERVRVHDGRKVDTIPNYLGEPDLHALPARGQRIDFSLVDIPGYRVKVTR